MEKQRPPIRVIAPGRVYRSDAVDATHSPVFHQIEGLVVDKGITMGDLKGTLEVFAKRLYGEDTGVRFRPHHFPFTEPSAEMDVTCFKCHGKGCPLCKGEGYIEILGCGMVHPKVLRGCDIDPEVYSGFAFGIGLERIVMQLSLIHIWNTEYPDMPNTDRSHPHRAGYMLWPAPKRPPKSGPKRPLSFLFPISCCDPSFPQRQALRPLIEWIHSTLSSPFFQTKWAKRKPDSGDIPRSPAKKTISSGCSVPQWPAARPGSRPAAPDTSPGCSFR